PGGRHRPAGRARIARQGRSGLAHTYVTTQRRVWGGHTMLAESLTVMPDSDAVAAAVAEWLMPHISGRRKDRALCLTGGDSPLPLYRLLAKPEYQSRVDWDHLQVFWTDERMVPHDHPDSNYGAARDALLRHVPVRPDHVHPMPVHLPPEQGAREYARRLQAYYG